jgi:beta-lactam-binding protein with PASTA domain
MGNTRTVTFALVATVVVGVVVADASARMAPAWAHESHSDEPEAATLAFVPARGDPGDTVSASGTGYAPIAVSGHGVSGGLPTYMCTLSWDQTLLPSDCEVDSAGRLTATFTVPIGAVPGSYTVVAESDGAQGEATFTVVSWVEVPDVVGNSRADAPGIVHGAGFCYCNEEYEEAGSDLAIAQEPSAGTMAEQGTCVYVDYVAAVTVPDVVGETVDTARQRLLAAGLRLTGPSGGGRVIEQEPVAGAVVPLGSGVRVRLEALARVPDVVGLTGQEAGRRVAARGLVLLGAADADREVVEQAPAAGAVVPRGSGVRVRLEELPAAPDDPDSDDPHSDDPHPDDPADDEVVQVVVPPPVVPPDEGTDQRRNPRGPAGRRVEAPVIATPAPRPVGNPVAEPRRTTVPDVVGETRSAARHRRRAMVSVPDVAGLTGSEAGRRLRLLGLVLDGDDDPERRVVAQSPGADTVVPHGSTVRISLGALAVPRPSPRSGWPAAAGLAALLTLAIGSAAREALRRRTSPAAAGIEWRARPDTSARARLHPRGPEHTPETSPVSVHFTAVPDHTSQPRLTEVAA